MDDCFRYGFIGCSARNVWNIAVLSALNCWSVWYFDVTAKTTHWFTHSKQRIFQSFENGIPQRPVNKPSSWAAILSSKDTDKTRSHEIFLNFSFFFHRLIVISCQKIKVKIKLICFVFAKKKYIWTNFLHNKKKTILKKNPKAIPFQKEK